MTPGIGSSVLESIDITHCIILLEVIDPSFMHNLDRVSYTKYNF